MALARQRAHANVGADIIRPPTLHAPNVGAAISRPPTWQVFGQNRIGQTGVPILQNVPCFDNIPPNCICKCLVLHCRRFAPTLFPRWGNNRAADSRPYNASKFPLRKFGGTAPTWRMPPPLSAEKGKMHFIVNEVLKDTL